MKLQKTNDSFICHNPACDICPGEMEIIQKVTPEQFMVKLAIFKVIGPRAFAEQFGSSWAYALMDFEVVE